MNLDRVELADVTDGPAAMAAALHVQLGPLSVPVPIEAIASALDITEIRRDRFDGFEGMLLTDRKRNYGKILANTRHNPRRTRFTIAHELGHFLLEEHVLSVENGFTCLRGEMSEQSVSTLQQRQETEANRFAIELLAPAYRFRACLACAPDLNSVQLLFRDLDISVEATARRYIDLHDDPLAIVVSKNNAVRYAAWNDRFPQLRVSSGQSIPAATEAARVVRAGKPGVMSLGETSAAAWVRDASIGLLEQTRLGKEGNAITLLWAASPDIPDEPGSFDDPDEAGR